MKFRLGFVSNSSTSCFICQICGEVDGSMDASASDFGILECVNGHTFHGGCSGLSDEIISLAERSSEDLEEWLSENGDDIKEEVRTKIKSALDEEDYAKQHKMFPIDLGNGLTALGCCENLVISESACPMCQMTHMDNDEVMEFLLKSGIISKDFIKNEVKSRFKNYGELWKYVNGKN